MARGTDAMRAYWNERAELNAVFYVDTSLDWANPDMEQFLATGRRIVEIGYDEAPVRPERHELAVDIGCGLGRISLGLRRHFDRVVGYDISPEMLRRARELVDDPAIELRQTDGATLPGLADGSADFVTSFTVFQHIPDVDVVRSYIAEAGRVLRPGGVFAFQWNNTPGSRRWRLERSVRALASRLGRGDRFGRDAPQFAGSRIELPVIDRALAAAGMERRGLREPDTLYAWAWAVKTGHH